MRHFAIMIAMLAGAAVVLIIIGTFVWASLPKDSNQREVQRAGDRISPVSAVYAGDTGRAAMAAAKTAAAKAAASQVAYGGTLDGKTIFNNLCTTCHTNPATGAPDIHDKAAWAPRIKEGIATLVQHAIHGYKGPTGNGPQMPAKGGNPALTDAQIEATVKWMVSQAK
ncbi:MAG: cytochrome c5 family protein [Rhodanobacteraceae bacterium]|nr:MAG: cytochrome c5 family protein [Rhodanobacteraceae bacterium]